MFIFLSFFSMFIYYVYFHYLLSMFIFNVYSNIEKVLVTTPHETPTIRPLASHHENYTS